MNNNNCCNFYITLNWDDVSRTKAVFSKSNQHDSSLFKNSTFKFPTKGASVKEEEEEFLKVLQSRAAAAEGKIEVVDITKKKSTVEVKELVTLSSVIEDLKKEYPGLVNI
jgi:hypothetical protein